MLVLADSRLPVRQAIATGRASERITGRGLGALTATLAVRTDAGAELPLPAQFHLRAEGHFVFALVPERDMPDLEGEPAVTLRATFSRPGAADTVVEAAVAGAAIALEEAVRTVGGRAVTVRRIAGAPFDLSLTVDPAPVALAGIVLRDNDPAAPAAGVTVTAGPASAVTDAGGRFFLAALPLQADVVLDLADGAASASRTHHVDYETPVNRVTLSLPS